MNALHGKLLLSGHDKYIPHLAREIEMPAVRHRRRGETLPELRETLAEMTRAGLRIEARENAIVIARKEQAPCRERRLHVAALTSLRPCNGRVCLARIVRRDVAIGLWANRADWPPFAMCARQKDQ